jgi:hypothetical protein
VLTGFVLGGCGQATVTALAVPSAVANELPTLLGDLTDLCTTVAVIWRDPSYQRQRKHRLRQARLLSEQVRLHPKAKIVETFTDADSGSPVRTNVSVRQLAKDQVEYFDIAHACFRRGTPTSARAARNATLAVNGLRDAIAATA